MLIAELLPGLFASASVAWSLVQKLERCEQAYQARLLKVDGECCRRCNLVGVSRASWILLSCWLMERRWQCELKAYRAALLQTVSLETAGAILSSLTDAGNPVP